ncbi:MAG: DUF2782 domain-containing protein [Marinobacter sp.]|uniref:DUF2782 domain-containing protein n=1 Tax=Marinobacter sp. TaxID=50741 RepID=UPI003F9B22DB
MKRIACFAVMLAWGLGAAVAQESDALDTTVVETPEEPVVISDYQPSDSGPQIVIRSGDDKVFYEYRVNGQLMEIKVVPEVGSEYYLVPADGGGWARESDSDMLVPSWILLRW